MGTRERAAKLRGRPAQRLPAPRLRSAEERYRMAIAPLVGRWRSAVEVSLFPVLDYVGVPAKPRADDAMDLLEHVFAGIRIAVARIFDDRHVDPIAVAAAESVDTQSRDLLRRQVRTVLSADPLIYEPWLLDKVRAFVRENASLIKSIPTEGLSDIEQMVYREARRGLSPNDMRARIVDLFGASESRAALIARDQVGKFNGDLTKLRQVGIGVSEYVWRTSRDERVRPDHRELNGTTQRWDSPPVTVTSGSRAGERNHPGEDIQCRCHAEPVLDGLLGRQTTIAVAGVPAPRGRVVAR